ncbi:hypothetical protein Arub01_14650 [Actinomadura rubrobrunea]|uniref:Uncharacterized protein n=1 Tax=Actinomadura rubrobrunea TaxID=115335 RepID=A0A9W6PU25_9ACTN|nr:hypothetical protein Arub01_14650 [Actinomadura rubrobrunea]
MRPGRPHDGRDVQETGPGGPPPQNRERRRWGRKRRTPDPQSAARPPYDEPYGEPSAEWQHHAGGRPDTGAYAEHAAWGGSPWDAQDVPDAGEWQGHGAEVPGHPAEWHAPGEDWHGDDLRIAEGDAGPSQEWQEGADGEERQSPEPGGSGRKRPWGKKRKRAGREESPADRPGGGRPPQRPAGKGRGPSKKPAQQRGGGLGALPPRVFYATAGALAVVFLVGALAVLALGGGDDGAAGRRSPQSMGRSPAASGPAPASYSSSPSSAVYQGIAQRSADRAPLTEAEAFPASANTITVEDAGLRLKLKAKSLDADCVAAVWGTGMGEQLREHGCTQTARTLYADGDGRYALSVTVFNLASASDADRFVDEIGRARGGGFVLPLPAEAPLDRFGQGFGMARGLAMGHYAVVAWAQRLDGKGDGTDETLLSLLIEGGKAPGPLGRAARAS